MSQTDIYVRRWISVTGVTSVNPDIPPPAVPPQTSYVLNSHVEQRYTDRQLMAALHDQRLLDDVRTTGWRRGIPARDTPMYHGLVHLAVPPRLATADRSSLAMRNNRAFSTLLLRKS